MFCFTGAQVQDRQVVLNLRGFVTVFGNPTIPSLQETLKASLVHRLRTQSATQTVPSSAIGRCRLWSLKAFDGMNADARRLLTMVYPLIPQVRHEGAGARLTSKGKTKGGVSNSGRRPPWGILPKTLPYVCCTSYFVVWSATAL